MAIASSPLLYPPSSSPSHDFLPTKRKRLHDDLFPTKRQLTNSEIGCPGLNTEAIPLVQNAPARKGPFLDDDDDDNSDVEHASSIAENDSSQPADIVLDLTAPDEASIPPSIAAKTSKNSMVKVFRRSRGKPSACKNTAPADPASTARSPYGVHINELIKAASSESIRPAAKYTVEAPVVNCSPNNKNNVSTQTRSRHDMWTEKYRAQRFTDLVGDDRTHRDVLRWVKAWDPIVFPGSERSKGHASRQMDSNEDQKPHCKVLLLAGAPGLGKTTLAHVCARQAGYEVLEINASDDRSSNVVKGRIKDCLGTENVKSVHGPTKHGRKVRPVCVVVDEVDGVVGGASASGEGGFMKALVDMITLDQKNSRALAPVSNSAGRPRRKTANFRLLRPLIMVCNDLYSPSLRPLRSSNLAQIIHVKNPPLDKVVNRLQGIFGHENLPCDGDAIRAICETTWGIGSKDRNKSQAVSGGDLRGCLVAGEWVASRIRSCGPHRPRLTKAWVEENVIRALSHSSADARGVARGGTREIAERIFLRNAGFRSGRLNTPAQLSDRTAESATAVDASAKQNTMARLREIVDLAGESDRLMTDCFSAYAEKTFQDDNFLTKPNAGCEWLHFYDRLSTRIHHGQDWELGPYLAQPILGFHALFASSSQNQSASRRHFEKEEDVKPFSGFKASSEASETTKQNLAALQNLQSCFSVPLTQCFRSVESIVTELNPYLIRLLTPNIKPVVVGGGGETAGCVSVRRDVERRMLERSVAIMHDVGLKLEKIRIEASRSGQRNFIYRMEPPVDTLASFSTDSSTVSIRYSVCQAMDQEHEKYTLRKAMQSRQVPFAASHGKKTGTFDEHLGPVTQNPPSGDQVPTAPRRDFFGRCLSECDGNARKGTPSSENNQSSLDKTTKSEHGKVWVSFNEGFSNAVRKPITLGELLTELER